MVRVLETLKQRVPSDNIFLGDAQLVTMRGHLAKLPIERMSHRIQLLQMIGTNEFKLGETEQAIERLELARQMAVQAGDRIPPVALDGIEFMLAVANLRYGETVNCIENHTIDSCLLPIQGEGIHVDKQGVNQATKYFSELLKRHPDHLASRWLLNVSAMAAGGYPDQIPPQFLIPPEAFESEESIPRFYDRAPQLGLDTQSLAGGMIVDDFDGDHLLDIVVSNWDPRASLRYFHNDGDGSFSDRSQAAGLEKIYGGLNLIQADYDNDGDVDVLVLRGGWLASAGRHPNSLLRNDGQGNFTDVTFDAGLADRHYPTQTASWADYDNDGDLDLYIGNEKFPNQLFQNQGDGTFTDVAAAAGVGDMGYAKGVVWGDYDNDRYADIYVSNMDGPNRLFHNQGNGSFQEVAADLGVTKPEASFPLWFWDFNNDGVLDLFVASFWQDINYVAASFVGESHPAEMDRLYQGDGRGGFRDVASEVNLHRRVSVPMGSNFGDLDNDGFLDFYLGTGYPEYEGLMPNLMFRNDGGKRFLDVTSAGGFGHLQKGHGVAFADVDNDGDQDVFLEVGGWYAGDTYGDALFENPGFANHWITIRLIGTESNRSAIGARIRIDIKDGESQRSVYRWVSSGGSFGGNPLRQQIGLGKAERIELLEIDWPKTGKTQRFTDLDVDQFIEIREGSEEIGKLPLASFKFSSSPPKKHQHHHPGSGH